jgi:hypothetical protein
VVGAEGRAISAVDESEEGTDLATRAIEMLEPGQVVSAAGAEDLLRSATT